MQPKRKNKKKLIITLSAIFGPILLLIIGFTIYYCVTLKPLKAFSDSVDTIGFSKALDEHYPLSREEFEELVPYDKEKAIYIDSLPKYKENDTWDIYIYMCGSDLESSFKDNLSDTTNMNLYLEMANKTSEAKDPVAMFSEIQNILYENNLDFPDSFYKPVISEAREDNYEDSDDSDDVGSASADLMDIITTPIPENIRFIIQTGGAKKWTYPTINPNRMQRWVYDQKGFNEVYSGPLENMGSQEGLESFLNFTKNYDADHKFFIFWDHGSGSFGAEHDEIFNDSLSLKEIRDGFDKVYTIDSENPPFELLGFDACLMATTEAAKEFEGIAKYYVASEDIEFGGWKYASWITALSEDLGMNGAQLGKEIADSFISLATQQYLNYPDQEIPNHMGVYDLSKASKIYDQYALLIEQALKDSLKNPNVLAQFAKAAQSSIRYASGDYGYFNTCDLRIFMENLQDSYPQAKNIINLLDEATLYTRGRGHNQYSSSMSIYFPTQIDNLQSLMQSMKYIDEVTDNMSVKTFYYYKSLGCLNNEYQTYLKEQGLPYALPLNTDIMKELATVPIVFTDDNAMKIELPQDMQNYIQDVKLIVAQYDDEIDKITYFGESNSARLEDNKIITDFDGQWLFLEDEPLSIELIDKNNNFIRYRSPVKLNHEESHIVITNNLVNNEILISGIKDDSLPSDTVDRTVKVINKGDKIKPLYETTNGFWLKQSIDEGNTVKYKEGNNLLNISSLKDGSYLQFVEVKDIRGNEYNTPVVEFEITNGKITNPIISEDFVCF